MVSLSSQDDNKTTCVPINGLDGASGGYLLPPMTEEQLGIIIADLDFDNELVQLVLDWAEGMAARDALRAPSADVTDAGDLAQTGWGVIFAESTPQSVREALSPLLTRRSQQAGTRFRQFEVPCGVTRTAFFTMLEMKAGTVTSAEMIVASTEASTESDAVAIGDSKPYLPYYLLLVGDPSEIPFRFQSELDVQYAVGRLHFANPEAYASYANAVIAAENDTVGRKPNLTFFAVQNSGDCATKRTAEGLIAELDRVLKASRSDWTTETFPRVNTTRDSLRSLLGGSQTPAILFTASHGIGLPLGDPRQLEAQGSLVCAEWPGPSELVRREHYFTAGDLAPSANLQGTIVFHFACYSAGTPELDQFEQHALGSPGRIAKEPFVANLPQRLLELGALAVIGHVDRAWTSSFTWNGRGGHVQLYYDTLKLLMDEFPVGWAMERMGAHAGDQALALLTYWEQRAHLNLTDYAKFSDLWRATNDMKNFIIIGDPAVRVKVERASA